VPPGDATGRRDLVRNTWYDVHSLSDLEILLASVRAALVADVIVVSVYAADELPLDLYVWINAWLPRRNSREGAFTALIGADNRKILNLSAPMIICTPWRARPIGLYPAVETRLTAMPQAWVEDFRSVNFPDTPHSLYQRKTKHGRK
jgi:hypothetical protein